MAKINLEFGKFICEMLDSRNYSLRAAAIKTGVDHTTIGQMRSGMVPKKGILIDFATGMDIDVNQLLTLAGYDPIPPELVGGRVNADDIYTPKNVIAHLRKSGKLPEEAIRQIEEIIRETEEADLKAAREKEEQSRK